MTRYVLERLIEPTLEPVTKAELKQHLRLIGSSEDDRLDELIATGREYVENYTGRALVDQTWRLTLLGSGYDFHDLNTVTPARPGFYCGDWFWNSAQEIRLRRSPAIALSSFVSVDSAGAEHAVDPTSYALREADSKWPRLVALSGATWNEWMNYDLRVTYRAGYADRTGSPTEDASVIPRRYKTAIKLVCEAYYDRNDKMMMQLIESAEKLLRNDCCEISLA